MSQQLTVQVPEDLFAALRAEAERERKTLQQLTLECVSRHLKPPRAGTTEALRPYKGCWKWTDEERSAIERMLETERNMETEDE